jgi:UDP-glucose:(heptosyl)LPS alpha-1,3-glucosyltransferase
VRIAFAIVSLFPGGGLQRDCAALARRVQQRGHQVTIFAARIAGGVPADIAVERLPNWALTNHGRNRSFAADLSEAAQGFDRIVGFDKLPELDVLYCADPCVAARDRSLLARMTSRYRAYTTFEEQCFARGQATRLMVLSRAQFDSYRGFYDTEPSRITLLPPTIDMTRRRPELRRDGTRAAMRAAFGIPPDDWLWLAVGAQAKTKGFDRIVTALGARGAGSPMRLLVAGIDASSRVGIDLLRLADSAGCRDRISLAGFREDVPALMAAADVFVHPARYETTGTAILEAVVNGLPVVTTAACGYAEHVMKANAGLVIPEPFDQGAFQSALRDAGERTRAAQWSDNAIRYGENPELYRGLDQAADIILGTD